MKPRGIVTTAVPRVLVLLLLALSSTQVSGGMIDLVCAAEAENVKRISVPPDHTFFLKLTCINCRSEFPNAIGVSSEMVVEGIRGVCSEHVSCSRAFNCHGHGIISCACTCTPSHVLLLTSGPAGASVSVQMKCKGCDRQHDITIQPPDPKDAWEPDSKDGWCRFATFEVWASVLLHHHPAC